MKKRPGYYSGIWHVTINSHVKKYLHGMGVNSVGVHDAGVHDMGPSVDMQCVDVHSVRMHKS